MFKFFPCWVCVLSSGLSSISLFSAGAHREVWELVKCCRWAFASWTFFFSFFSIPTSIPKTRNIGTVLVNNGHYHDWSTNPGRYRFNYISPYFTNAILDITMNCDSQSEHFCTSDACLWTMEGNQSTPRKATQKRTECSTWDRKPWPSFESVQWNWDIYSVGGSDRTCPER